MAEIALIGLQVAGTALSVIGAIQQGKAEQQSAIVNTEIANRNANIAESNAKAEEETTRRRQLQARGSQRAAISASGITLEGSPLDVLESTAIEQELEALSIRNRGQTEASNFRTEAEFSTQRGNAARKASQIRAGTALLSGASKTFKTTLGG